MKYSQFNSIVRTNGNQALYNSFTEKVVLLENDLAEILRAAVTEGIDELENVHPDLYHYLIAEEFILDTQVDEIEKVKKIREAVDYNASSYLLTINPTMNCNFKCWYCYETHIKSSKLTRTVLESTKLFITKKIQDEEIKHFNLAFFGGEPLLYFQQVVEPLIDHAVEECRKYNKVFSTSFTTNGFLINDSFINYFVDKNLMPNLQITFDGYRENHDKVRFVSEKRGSYFDIVENIKKLLKHRHFHVRARVNYTDENIHDCSKIADDFQEIIDENRSSQFLFDFHRVWQNGKLDDTDLIVNENVEKIRAKGFKVSTNLPDNLANSCYADKLNSSVINYNGDIFKCTARDFENKNREGYLTQEGEIVWENDSQNKRMFSKFKNKPCLSCRIMPLCNGGCSQQAIEHVDVDYCIYSGVESEKDKVVIKKIEEFLYAEA
ncbi:hypothetical protein CEY12_13200 [Chryseobacterium sp. T16E-39]|uniref:radical SAM/SPASM domain-containing protein n=1 Tax=Chryseobacterium sp. T16E-39 TaxID=2015076 RepID=UPI000B5B2C91|nr:radical SAM protein [Chryseobacterium sp. T16E-39]ASK31002.1 hypothetical protein CEY12_13200 [Chryseobacterium sp. T16E-39]